MKIPCRECPFRKASVPGWLGAYEGPEEITSLVMGNQKFPCHMAVDALMNGHGPELGMDEFEALATADRCVGALATMNLVGRRSDCFPNAEAMHVHHRSLKR